jgi:hypothetical protein
MCYMDQELILKNRNPAAGGTQGARGLHPQELACFISNIACTLRAAVRQPVCFGWVSGRGARGARGLEHHRCYIDATCYMLYRLTIIDMLYRRKLVLKTVGPGLSSARQTMGERCVKTDHGSVKADDGSVKPSRFLHHQATCAFVVGQLSLLTFILKIYALWDCALGQMLVYIYMKSHV